MVICIVLETNKAINNKYPQVLALESAPMNAPQYETELSEPRPGQLSIPLNWDQSQERFQVSYQNLWCYSYIFIAIFVYSYNDEHLNS